MDVDAIGKEQQVLADFPRLSGPRSILGKHLLLVLVRMNFPFVQDLNIYRRQGLPHHTCTESERLRLHMADRPFQPR